MQLKTYRYTFVVYSAILLLSLLLFYLFPKDALLDPDLQSGCGAEKDPYPDPYGQWAEGELDREGMIEPYRRWDFAYDGDDLEIVSAGGSEPQILVKRTAPGEGLLAAAEYRLCSSKYLENELNPYTIDLKGNRLTVRGAERVELKFRKFERDFTIDQFKEKKSERDCAQERLYRGAQFVQGLYLYIPEAMKIEYDPESIPLLFTDDE